MASRSSASAQRPNKFRWGMPPSPIALSPGKKTEDDIQGKSKSSNLLGWEDIDHSQTLDLGDLGSTSIVFQKVFDNKRDIPNYMVLRSCYQYDFTPEKRKLVEMAQAHDNSYFLATRSIFNYNQKVFVGSELSDISLADIIDCTIPINETQLSTILYQAARALHHLHADSARTGKPLIYGSLRASNIFIQRDGTVKLSTFGSKVCPEFATKKNRHNDLLDLGALVSHIISGISDEPYDIVRHRMISTGMSCFGRGLDMSRPSPELMDIWGLCVEGQDSLTLILNHPFSKLGAPSSLSRLVLNAERNASHGCNPTS